MTPDVTEQVYLFICQYDADHHYAPSVREIGKACFLSPSSVLPHLYKLEGQGKISRDPGRARSITVLRLPQKP